MTDDKKLTDNGMEKSRLIAWIEVAAAISVLVGLLLVAQELRQNNQYARADSIRDLFQMWSEIYRYQTDRNIDALMAKSYSHPADMTDEELRQLDGYYWMVMNAEWAQDIMSQEGLTKGDQEEFAKLIANSFFSSPFGRAWFKLNEAECRLHSEYLCEVISREIEANPVREKDDYIGELRSLL